VVCPSGIVGIVGIKPTLGLVSRSGIIPIAHSQDTAGPMARSVRDAAILLTAMTGVDARDPATADAESHHDYSASLTADGLRGKRVGVIRSWYGAGTNPHVDDIFEASIEALKTQGAEIVDDLEIETEGMYDPEYEVLLYEFKADLATYFESSAAPFDTLAEVIAFNEANASSIMSVFGQEIFLEAEEKGPLTDEAYLTALAESKRISTEALNGAMDGHSLDALIAITNGPAWMIDHVNGDSFGIGSSSLAAISGYPSITVPAGFVSGLPIGLSFIGKPWNEKQLIEIAYAFEQATGVRRAPEF
jgi:amidase